MLCLSWAFLVRYIAFISSRELFTTLSLSLVNSFDSFYLIASIIRFFLWGYRLKLAAFFVITNFLCFVSLPLVLS